MQFLITNIGSKDLLLGYPWLAMFELRFNWHSAIIDECTLPVIISSINPHVIRQHPVIATMIWSWVKHHDTPKYKEGDQVWLEGKNLHINQPTTKLAPRRHGPFKVAQVMSPVNYCLELLTQWSIHPVFHINLLLPYWETITHGPNYQCPPPDLVEGEEEYSVEKILDSWLSAEDSIFNIWSNGMDTWTQTTCGSIRMTYLPMIRCGNSNNQALTKECI
jgi:hypothetical protein